MTVDEAALLDEAMKKSALIWVGPADGSGPARAVWHVWDDGTAYVLTGDGEQPAPVDAGVESIVIVRSKDKWSRLLTWKARAESLGPGETWDRITATMLTKRLNLTDMDTAVARWASKCTILVLKPAGGLAEAPGHYDPDSHASPPVETTAGTRVPRPWHLFGRPAERGRPGFGRPRRPRS